MQQLSELLKVCVLFLCMHSLVALQSPGGLLAPTAYTLDYTYNSPRVLHALYNRPTSSYASARCNKQRKGHSNAQPYVIRRQGYHVLVTIARCAVCVLLAIAAAAAVRGVCRRRDDDTKKKQREQ
jgi:hypothetical protein